MGKPLNIIKGMTATNSIPLNSDFKALFFNPYLIFMNVDRGKTFNQIF